MKIKIRGTAEGAVADIIEPGQDSGVEESLVTSIDIPAGKELNVNLPTATVVEQIEYADVVDTPSPPPAGAPDQPGGGNEGSTEAGTPGPAGGPTDPDSPGPDAKAEGGVEVPDQGGVPASGEGEAGKTPDTPTTSAASEKPLYLVDGDTLLEGFEESGLETPDGRTLFHFESDTAGQSATGNADGVSVYADADDNEQPVQAAQPADAAPSA